LHFFSTFSFADLTNNIQATVVMDVA